MKQSTKAVLLSGLVFPGLGQLVIRRYRAGLFLMLSVAAAAAAIVVITVQKALDILARLQAGGGPIDFAAITQAARAASGSADAWTIRLLMLLIVACWAAGMVDAYRNGRRQDVGAQSADPAAGDRSG